MMDHRNRIPLAMTLFFVFLACGRVWTEDVSKMTALFRGTRAAGIDDDFLEFDNTTWQKSSHRLGRTDLMPESVTQSGTLLSVEIKAAPDWTGGEIQSKERYRYGSYRVRMKAAPGRGAMSAFFTYFNDGSETNQEIDVEIIGDKPQEVVFTTWVSENTNTTETLNLGFDATASFHEYGFDWCSDKVEFYVDGQHVHTSKTNVPSLPSHVMVNGWIPQWTGEPDFETTSLQVDWVVVESAEHCFRMAVTEPDYDDIGEVLDNMGYDYTEITPSSLADQDFDLSQFDVIFVNCSWDAEDHAAGARERLKSYVSSGGSLYASDWAYTYVEEAFPDYIAFPVYPKIGHSQMLTAEVVDPGLAAVLNSDTIQLNYDLPGWVVIESVADQTTIHLQGSFQDMVDKPLLVSFKYGEGQVVYTTFHNGAQVSEQETELLWYLVLKTAARELVDEAEDYIHPSYEIESEIISYINDDEVKTFVSPLFSGRKQFILNWAGSELGLEIRGPDDSVLFSEQSSSPPLVGTITLRSPGDYEYRVSGLNVPHNNYPFVLLVGMEVNPKFAKKAQRLQKRTLKKQQKLIAKCLKKRAKYQKKGRPDKVQQIEEKTRCKLAKVVMKARKKADKLGRKYGQPPPVIQELNLDDYLD